MGGKRPHRRERAEARYGDMPTADLIRARGLASLRSAQQALGRVEPLVKARRVRPADVTAVSALADAMVGAILSAIADLEVEGDRDDGY